MDLEVETFHGGRMTGVCLHVCGAECLGPGTFPLCAQEPQLKSFPGGAGVKNSPAWMKLEPIIQSEVSQKAKHQCSILMHIYRI